jgi:hypothetical protein
VPVPLPPADLLAAVDAANARIAAYVRSVQGRPMTADQRLVLSRLTDAYVEAATAAREAAAELVRAA